MQPYLEALVKNLKHGDASERTHYSALEVFVENLGKNFGHKCDAAIEPRNQQRGIPDFIVRDERGRVIGHIEAKDLDKKLDDIETTTQLTGYLAEDGYSNLILTNYWEFRLYKNGKKVDEIVIADPSILGKGVVAGFREEELERIFRDFFSTRTAQIRTPKTLAVSLAQKARILRDRVIKYELENEKDSPLWGAYQTFKEYLLPDLSIEQFADIYAQTMAYGLFVARLHAPEEEFDRRSAAEFVPKNIHLLRSVFSYFTGAQTPDAIVRLVDEIVDILAATKIPDLVGNLKHTKRSDDPIVYFYEDFMKEYDPKERELRGQYYTPAQIVSYMISSVHQLIKDGFNKPLGLADSSIHILDPAVGTATFPAEIIMTAIKEIEEQGQSGSQQQVANHLLENISSFELMMGSYVVGHIKIDVLLRELNLQMQREFRLYLTNTLENQELQPSFAPMASELSEETHQALEVKNKEDILVIVGNPPYSGHSSNKGEWITKLMRGLDTSTNKQTANYFEVDGTPLNERQPKWLNDDYVKFIRFGQWKIDQKGEGILAFITNHAWLDNPTFRGMRQSLLNSFDEIYVYDLHGSTKKNESVLGGGKDENVFDIQQGVAISFFVKYGDGSTRSKHKVKHAELYGLREMKYDVLLDNSYDTTEWRELKPTTPNYLFIPATEDSDYMAWPSIDNIFLVSSVGIVTARDSLTIDFDEHELMQRIRQFGEMDAEEARFTFNLGKDVEAWKVVWAQNDVKATGLNSSFIKQINYRPFDIRHTYYTGHSNGIMARPARQVMEHMLQRNNLALILPRRVEAGRMWEHVFCVDRIFESHTVSLKEINYGFPLWLSNNSGEGIDRAKSEQSNFKPEFLKELRQRLPNTTEEEIFFYIYGILYTPAYREKYNEFLRRDFPHIPWPKNKQFFDAINVLGQRLVAIHTMKNTVPPLGRFEGNGDSSVKRRSYLEDKIWINGSQHFTGIPLEIWEYRIGGYQVLEKWLKSHKGRYLSVEETLHFCNVAAILQETIKIQHKLDQVYRG